MTNTPVLADCVKGAELFTTEYGVTRSDLVRYAGASGDFNPIHWSQSTAQSVGLPDVIAHGMYTLALAGRAVGAWCDDPGRIVDISARFTKPVVVPDGGVATVSLTGSCHAVDEESKRITVNVKAVCGDATVLGKARVVVDLA